MQLWLEQLPLHTFEVRTEHRHMQKDAETNSPGLATLQAAAELIENKEKLTTDADTNGEIPSGNLSTLTDAELIENKEKHNTVADTNGEVPPDNLSTLADAAQAMSSENK